MKNYSNAGYCHKCDQHVGIRWPVTVEAMVCKDCYDEIYDYIHP